MPPHARGNLVLSVPVGTIPDFLGVCRGGVALAQASQGCSIRVISRTRAGRSERGILVDAVRPAGRQEINPAASSLRVPEARQPLSDERGKSMWSIVAAHLCRAAKCRRPHEIRQLPRLSPNFGGAHWLVRSPQLHTVSAVVEVKTLSLQPE